MNAVLDSPISSVRVRSSISTHPQVKPDGGDFESGYIADVAIISLGEAWTHDEWVDQEMIDSVVRLGNESDGGIKIRFSHPPLFGDSLGMMLGRAKNFRKVAGRAVADLHFLESSRVTPNGDLAGYVMRLATEDPAGLGMSIVFIHDREAERQFVMQHRGAGGAFKSPDVRNTNNHSHMRIATLVAADVVDSPSTNPDGMFSAKVLDSNPEWRRKVEQLRTEYRRFAKLHESLGMSEERWVNFELESLAAEMPAAEPIDNPTDAESAARAEFRQHAKLHASLGQTSEDEYVKWRAAEILAEA